MAGGLERIVGFGRSPAAPLIAAAAIMCSLAVASLMPVYTDEIVWRWHERAWLDGGFDSWMNDQCGRNTIARAPWFVLPVRWFSATVNTGLPHILAVRLQGIACAVLGLALLWRLAGRLIADHAARNAARTFALALLGLGATPYLLALSRPEQPLILALGSMALIALGRERRDAARAWLRSLTILALAVIALSYHLKGVAYIPVALVCLFGCAGGRETIVPRVSCAVALAAFAVLAADYWSTRFACPDSPALAARFAAMNFSAALAAGQTSHLSLASLALHATPVNYIALAAPSPDPMSFWLPPHLFAPSTTLVYRIVMVGSWAALVTIAGVSAVRAMVTRRLAVLSDLRFWLAGAIVACMLVWGFTQITKHMYEAALVLPLLAVAALALLGVLGEEPPSPVRALPVMASLTLIASLISQAHLAAALLPSFREAAAHPGFAADQPNSVSVAGDAAIRRDTLEAARRAGLRPAAAWTRLVLDEVTYLTMQRSTLPFVARGVFGDWSEAPGGWARYLRERRSDGVVVDCRSLPAEALPRAHRAGPICALGPGDFAALP